MALGTVAADTDTAVADTDTVAAATLASVDSRSNPTRVVMAEMVESMTESHTAAVARNSHRGPVVAEESTATAADSMSTTMSSRTSATMKRGMSMPTSATSSDHTDLVVATIVDPWPENGMEELSS